MWAQELRLPGSRAQAQELRLPGSRAQAQKLRLPGSRAQAQELRLPGSTAQAQELWLMDFSCSIAPGIFLDQGLNLCLLHWQVDSLPLSHQESLIFFKRFFFLDVDHF